MSQRILVEHKSGDLFDVSIRGHCIQMDQPTEAGGSDFAPTPTEFFVASLASCVAFYARRYLARHGLPEGGLAVRAEFEMAERPARVGVIRVVVTLPEGVPEDRHRALLAMASHCTVHNSLLQHPEISIELGAPR